MKIISINRNKKYKDKLTVYLDNNYHFTLSESDYISLHLYEKDELSEEELRHITENVLYRFAKSLAVKFLSMKLRCENEVKTRLEEEGFDVIIINSIVEEMKSMGYVNDNIYAQKYIYDRSKLKPKSKKMLKLELKNKGLSDEIIDSALEDWEVDEDLLAENLVRKKFGKYDFNDEKITRKAYMFLQHRGFDHATISAIINKMRIEED